MHIRAFSLSLFSVCAIAVAACGGGSSTSGKTPATGASSVPAAATITASQTKPTATSAAAPTKAAAVAPSAEAWCTLVIDINTRHGYMKDKRYLPAQQVSADTFKAIGEEGISRRDEILAITPPEIKDAMTAELDYFAASKANNFSATTPLGSFTPALQQQLVTFQTDQCGISFG
jgi:hypothetical protein